MHLSTALALVLSIVVQANAMGVPLTKNVNASLLVTTKGYANFSAVNLNIRRAKAKFAANEANLQKNVHREMKHKCHKHSNSKHCRNLDQRFKLAKRKAKQWDTADLTWQGALWTGPISVGTPKKTYYVDMDSGSTDLILCGKSTCSNGNTRRKYLPANSSTANSTSTYFYNAYGDGSSTTGMVYEDTVRFGALSATGQTINVASEMGGILASINADGLLGFAYPSLSAVATGSSLPNTLYTDGSIKSFTFGFRLSTTAAVSECYMGGWNKNKMTGSLSWYPIAPDPDSGLYSYLQIGNTFARVNGAKVAGTTATYIVDTGTTLILAPVAAAKAFWAAVDGSKAMTGSQEGYYSFPCSSAPTISFSFAGSSRKHTVAAADFSIGKVTGDSTRCLGAVIGADAGVGDSWIIGDSFLKNQYTVFALGKKQIGFATPV